MRDHDGETVLVRGGRRLVRAAAAIACLLALALAGACGRQPDSHAPPLADADPTDTAAVDPARWPGFPLLPDGRFPIAGWCAPPVSETTDGRYAEYADAGFTVVLPAVEDPYLPGPNLERLEIAGRQGLFVIVRDDRLHPDAAWSPGWRAAADSVTAAYRDHPALLGYFLADEPEPDLFASLAAVTRHLARRDPRHPAYVNLLGESTPGREFQGRTYSAYVKEFVATMRPAFFSLDNYVLLDDGTDVPTFCSGWDSARTAARGAPFWAVLLLTRHGPFRQPGEGELSWQAHLALAHGARGIVWFTYWTPDPSEPFRYTGGPIAYDGSRNASYTLVSRVNATLQPLGRELATMDCVDVRHSGRLPRGGRPLEGGAVEGAFGVRPGASGGADLTFGLFRDQAGRRHVLVVNRDHGRPMEAEITGPEGVGRWTGRPGEYIAMEVRAGRFRLTLDPGGAALLRLPPP